MFETKITPIQQSEVTTYGVSLKSQLPNQNQTIATPKSKFTISEKQMRALYKKYKLIDRPQIYNLWNGKIDEKTFFESYCYECDIIIEKEIYDKQLNAKKKINFVLKYNNRFGFNAITRQALSAYLEARHYLLKVRLYRVAKDSDGDICDIKLDYKNILERK